MGGLNTGNQIDRDMILAALLQILEEVGSNWQLGFAGRIGPETRLGADLAFESIQIVRLAVAIQKHFNRQDLPFQDLFLPKDGRVNDLRVSEVADFLHLHLGNLQDPALANVPRNPE